MLIHSWIRDSFFAYQKRVLDKITFFLKYLASVTKLLDIFSFYSQYFVLKPNLSRSEIAGIASLKVVEVETFLTAVSNIQDVLKIWQMMNLTLDGKVIYFETLALFKIFHLCLTSVLPK